MAEAMNLETLNNAPEAEALEGFVACCGAKGWAAAMVSARPYTSLNELFNAADSHWAKCTDDDYLEAFSAHPRIGGKKAQSHQSNTASGWSKQEQSGAQSADDATKAQLAEANDAYYERFGFIFIVCATGKTAPEMLALLQARLPNDRPTEIANAAEEQRKITRIRLEKWLGETP